MISAAMCRARTGCGMLHVSDSQLWRMKRLLPTTTLSRIVMVAAFSICVSLCVPANAYAADSPQGQPKSSPGQAEQSPEEAAGGKQNSQRMRKACDEDAKKLCPDIRPGGGRILQCLRGQESHLSPACRQA